MPGSPLVEEAARYLGSMLSVDFILFYGIHSIVFAVSAPGYASLFRKCSVAKISFSSTWGFCERSVFGYLHPTEAETSPLEVKVKELMENRRVQRVRAIVTWGVPLALCTLPFVAYQLFCRSGLRNWTHEQVLVTYAWWSYVLCMMFFDRFPKYVTPTTPKLMYVFVVARMAYTVWKCETSLCIMVTASGQAFIRLFACIGVLNTRFTTSVNAILATLHCLIYVHRSKIRTVVDDLHPDHVVMYVFREFAYVVLSAILSSLVESSIAAEIRATLQSRASSRAEETVQSLLNALCDATVHVNHNLRISKPAPKLAALLLKDSAVTDLQDYPFQELMLENDGRRFQEHLHSCQPASNLFSEGVHKYAISIQVGMRDAYGTVIQASMFTSCFQDIDDQLHYIVGICESGCQRVPESPADEALPFFSSAGGWQSSSSECSNVDKVSDLQSSQGGRTSLRGMQGKPWMTFKVNAMDGNFSIKSCRASGAGFDGRCLRGSSFLQWVSGASRFHEWFQCKLNGVACGKFEGTSFAYGIIALKSKLLADSIEFTAKCEVMFDCEQIQMFSDGAEDDVTVKIMLTNLKASAAGKEIQPPSLMDFVPNILVQSMMPSVTQRKST